jgi:chaperone required for assembly of F1-ATPase
VKRFYKEVTVADDLSIRLDGKPILTPSKHKLVAPTRQLAEALAQEWREQGDNIVPATMHLTKLANTAIDSARRDDVINQLTNFARNDLLCYRASEPAELVRRQQTAWDPLLDWAHETYGARLETTHGVNHIAQDEAAIAALNRTLRNHDAWTLTGLHAATTITDSLILALAVLENRLSHTEAFAASRIDEAFQAEKWGLDAEAEARTRRLSAELETAALFMALAGS